MRKPTRDIAPMQTTVHRMVRSEPYAPAGARILAVDYGRSRIGLAIADATTGIAEPFGVLERINRNEDMRRLRELAREHGVRGIVVGLPMRLDGTHGEMAEEAKRFARRVRKQIGVPVFLVDERLTSWEAERLLEEHSGRVRKTHVMRARKQVGRKENSRPSVDAMAAAIILRDYLEGGKPRTEIRGVEA